MPIGVSRRDHMHFLPFGVFSADRARLCMWYVDILPRPALAGRNGRFCTPRGRAAAPRG
jgi:hypothetical protein